MCGWVWGGVLYECVCECGGGGGCAVFMCARGAVESHMYVYALRVCMWERGLYCTLVCNAGWGVGGLPYVCLCCTIV